VTRIDTPRTFCPITCYHRAKRCRLGAVKALTAFLTLFLVEIVALPSGGGPVGKHRLALFSAACPAPFGDCTARDLHRAMTHSVRLSPRLLGPGHLTTACDGTGLHTTRSGRLPSMPRPAFDSSRDRSTRLQI
jgi:hypothetical protein